MNLFWWLALLVALTWSVSSGVMEVLIIALIILVPWHIYLALRDK